MRMLGKISALVVLCCWGTLIATPAEAKVCFAGDGDCGGIDVFGGYEDPTNDIAEQCAKAGYETQRDKCLAREGKQITDYCPYDSNYVKCCSLEYQYDSCQYPMVQTGKCGNKYKCVCDPNKYKYTPESCKTLFANSTADGGSCPQVEYNPNTMSTTNKILFTECSCNEALYPYTKEDCVDGTAPTGRTCNAIDSNGARSTKYESCLCNRDIYQYTVNQCSNEASDNWGGDDSRKCIQGGNTYFANCLHCKPGGYTAENLNNVDINGVECKIADRNEIYPISLITVINGTRYVKPSVSAVCGYAKCPYGPRYKHLKCMPGYEVRDGTCQIMTCKQIVRLLAEAYPSKVTLIDDVTNSTTAESIIVADGITSVSTGINCGTYTTKRCTRCSCVSATMLSTCYYTEDNSICPSCFRELIDDPIIREPIIMSSSTAGSKAIAPIDRLDPLPLNVPCCTNYVTETKSTANRGLKCGSGRNYISARKFAKTTKITDSLVDAMVVGCKATPTLSFSGSSFPHSNPGDSGPLAFDDINLKFNNTTTVSRDVTVNDGDIDTGYYTLTFKRGLTLQASNLPRTFKGAGTVVFEGAVQSKGYAYDVYRITVLNQDGQNVFFKGFYSSPSTIFKATQFNVRGTAGFNYMKTDIIHTCVGCEYAVDNNRSEHSWVSLYNTNWYLFDSTDYSLKDITIVGRSMIGNMNGGGSKIIFNDNSMAYRVGVAGYDWKDCTAFDINYINENGVKNSYRMTNFICSGIKQGSGDRPHNMKCRVSGSKSWFKLEGDGGAGGYGSGCKRKGNSWDIFQWSFY